MKRVLELTLIFISIYTTAFLLISCRSEAPQTSLPQLENKKLVVYVNSYHRGYASSDSVMAGLTDNLPEDSIQLISFFMDTKRHNNQAYIDSISLSIKDSILAIEPDLLLVSDDNAVKHIVAPYFKNSPLPIIFCGVNWSAERYALPREHITGILEVLPLPQLLDSLKNQNPDGQKLYILTEQSTSAQNNRQLLDTLFRNAGFEPHYALVSTFDAWQDSFIMANQQMDFIYLPTNGAIQAWDTDKAKALVNEYRKIPVVSCDDFMSAYTTLTISKVAREQGEWAAFVARQILFNGISPADIPVARNKQYRIFHNKELITKQ